MEGINVLSGFDGMGCIWQALERMGIKVNKRYSSEIDQHAIKVTKEKWPDIIHLGSITGVKASDLERIDLVVGGSPCQGFSFAGKMLNFNDPRSALFFEFDRLVKECMEINPDIVFLLENVRMKKEHEDVISRILGIQPININSALVSAQNRERLYWTNIGMVHHGLFSDNCCSIPQPKDRLIFLKNILQDNVDEKYFLKEKAIKHIYRGGESITDDVTIISKNGDVKANQNKAACFTAGGNSGGNHSYMDLLLVKQGCLKYGCTEEAKNIRRASMRKGVDYSPFQGKEITGVDYDKMNTLVTGSAKDNLIIVHNTMPRSSKSGKGGTGPLSRTYGKTYCLDTGNTNAIEIRGADLRVDDGIRIRSDYKSGTLLSRARNDESCGQLVVGVNQGFEFMSNVRIRRLTPIEVCRLQTVDDEYFMYPIGYIPPAGKNKAKNDDGSLDSDGTYNPGEKAGNPVMYKGVKRYFIVSDTQIYKMCGNGWTVEAIMHILSFSKFNQKQQ